MNSPLNPNRSRHAGEKSSGQTQLGTRLGKLPAVRAFRGVWLVSEYHGEGVMVGWDTEGMIEEWSGRGVNRRLR